MVGLQQIVEILFEAQKPSGPVGGAIGFDTAVAAADAICQSVD